MFSAGPAAIGWETALCGESNIARESFVGRDNVAFVAHNQDLATALKGFFAVSQRALGEGEVPASGGTRGWEASWGLPKTVAGEVSEVSEVHKAR